MIESDGAANDDLKQAFVVTTYGAGVCATALTMVAMHMVYLSGVVADTRGLKVDTPVAAAASIPASTMTDVVPGAATETTTGAATETKTDAAGCVDTATVADAASNTNDTSGASDASAVNATALPLQMRHSIAMYARRRAVAELLALVAGAVAFGFHTAAGLPRGKFVGVALGVCGAYAFKLVEYRPHARRACDPDALRRWGLAPTPAEAAAALQQAVAVTAYAALSMLALPGGGARFFAALGNPSFWVLLIAYVLWGTVQHWVALGVCARALEHLLAVSGHRAFGDPQAAQAAATVVVGAALGLAHAAVWASGVWALALAPLCMAFGVAWASIFMRHACLCPLGACYGLLFTLYYFVVLDVNPFRAP